VQNWILTLAASPLVYLWMYLFAAIDGFFPPIPSESLVISLAALSVSSGQPNLALVILTAAAGAFTGDQIAYSIGKRLAVSRLPFMQTARARRTLDWAERTLSRRGAAFILAARYIPVGRVAVNMTAGAVGYSRRRFVGLVVIASFTWALYCAAIGIGTGTWFRGHPIRAVVVGVVSGLLIGAIVDLGIERLTLRKKHAAEPPEPAA
jgi:membrane-associated protein